MHTPLTDGDILAAAADGTAPYELCWRAFGPPGAERDAARAQIAELLAATPSKPWDRPTCTLIGLGRMIVLEDCERSGERPCKGCHQNREICNGDATVAP
jgi:hypothetical protein